MSLFVLPVDESNEEEEPREETREEQELGVVTLWMEVGDLPMLVEEEAQIIAGGISPFYSTWHGSVCQSILSLLSIESNLCGGSHFFRAWICWKGLVC